MASNTDVLTGSCFCNKIKVELVARQYPIGICHCTDCRKLSGAPYTLNLIAKSSELKLVSGSPAEINKVADGGNKVRNYYCRDCGSPLYGGTIPPGGGELESLVIRAGMLDDLAAIGDAKPIVEIYAVHRLKWILPVEGCAQIDGMLPSS